MKKLFSSGLLLVKNNKHHHIFRIMRLTTYLLLLFTCAAFAENASSQNARVNLNQQHAVLKDVLEEIEKQTDYLFISNREIDLEQKVSVKVANRPVKEALNQLFTGTDLTYSMEGINIILTKNETRQQQQRAITGVVTDNLGEPVIGANVIEKGTTNGVITDMDGNFALTVSDNAVIQISYIGYIPQEIPVGNRITFRISLKEDSQNLDEVVVVAYGTQKKVNLTGAITSIKADNLENRPSSNVVNMLTGQLPGVTVIQNSGQPGEDVGTLRVRGIGTLGNSEAMVIVDGIESSMNNVDPNDIENIVVLKDAAASSIYGVRAANGVILVTTKKGTIGKPVISYNGYTGWQSASRMPDFLNSADYATLLNEAYSNDGLPAPYTGDEIEKFRNGSDPDHYPNSDWAKALISESGFFHNHYLNMAGGTENTQYSVSLGYHEKGGIIPNSSYNRYNLRSNIDTKVNDRLSVYLNLAMSRDRTLAPTTDIGTLFYWNLRETPTTPIQFSNGNYGLHLNEHNSVAFARNGGTNKKYKNDLQGNIGFSYKIIEGLLLKGSAATRFNLTDIYQDTKSMNFYTADLPDPVKTTRSEVYNQDDKMLEINLQAYLDYSKTIGKHDIKGLLGYSQIQNEWKTVYAGRKDLPENNSLGQINAGDINTQETKGYRKDYALRSVFGRVNYSFDDRYLLEANMRYDGTSRFPKNNRFGVFPSFSAGWRISEEAFFNSPVVDNLKIRGSWGKLGNQEIGDYAFLNTYVFGMNYPFNNILAPGISINETMENKAITWETTTQVDVGVDADFWNGKLSVTFDYFNKVTDDILLNLPAPYMLGVKPPMQNAGSVVNRGVELLLTHRNQVKDFRYSASFNFSYIHNEITDLKGSDQPGRSVGDPINNIYGYVVDKIFDSQEEIDNSPTQIWGAKPGDFKYKDLNNDNVIDDKDRKSLGTYFPKIFYGFRLEFGYKQFDFSTLLQGAGAVNAIVRGEIDKAFLNGGKVTSKHLDRWTPGNTSASYPRLTIKDATRNNYDSDYWMQNASYLKMRNIQVGYTLPQHVISKIGLSRLRVYFSGDNLLTITSFDGVDPEASYNPTGEGHSSYYPLTKSFSFGINASF